MLLQEYNKHMLYLFVSGTIAFMIKKLGISLVFLYLQRKRFFLMTHEYFVRWYVKNASFLEKIYCNAYN